MRPEMTARYPQFGALQPRILDVGIGAHPFPHGVAVDLRAVPGVHAQADASIGLPFPDNVFDGVRASNVLEHMPASLDFLEEAWRVLRHGGALLLATPHLSSLSATWGDPTHRRAYSINSFRYFDSTQFGNYADRFDFRVNSVRVRRRNDDGLLSRALERAANRTHTSQQRMESYWGHLVGGFVEVECFLTAVKNP
ncbi:MAG TPA: methyltransferase domain-containing protein [Acidimicrobiales bacterium]|nr:methyltransferase domain-containing protein [Acidimicrobiales bacterium]